ncbi:MAG: NAD(P)-dependent oxidoreductase [Burkholderiales bacterium]|nr:NAD(P)-dependent oxidoreductase [Burkholderiales bacterium]MDW8469598.1 NAD(P)-dependent oxidoreductase [Burkholderiales bacterium]
MTLGFIGIGLMGKPMVLRLLAAGYEVRVWNRTREKLAPVLEKGARPMESPAALARACEIVMMCVTDQHAAEAVLFGPAGVAEGASPGTLVVDFSSIAPQAAREFARRLEEKGVGLVDAPVSGGVPGAENGTLVVMAGGAPEHIERVRPVVMHLAQRFTRMGDCGAGQTTKLCNQVIVGSLLPVIAEAVRLAEAAGVDATRLPEALEGGFADSLPLRIFGARMAARRFEPPLGAAATLLKDLENAAALARERGVPLPMARTAAELYRLLEAQGRSGEDPAVLVELLAGRTSR